MNLSSDMKLKLTLLPLLTVFVIWASIFMANGGNEKALGMSGLTLESVSYTRTETSLVDSRNYHIYLEDGTAFFSADYWRETDGGRSQVSFTRLQLDASVMENLAEIVKDEGGASKLKNEFSSSPDTPAEEYVLTWSSGKKTGPGKGGDSILDYLHSIADAQFVISNNGN